MVQKPMVHDNAWVAKERIDFLEAQRVGMLATAGNALSALKAQEVRFEGEQRETVHKVIEGLEKVVKAYKNEDEGAVKPLVEPERKKILAAFSSSNSGELDSLLNVYIIKHPIARDNVFVFGQSAGNVAAVNEIGDKLITQLDKFEELMGKTQQQGHKYRLVNKAGTVGFNKLKERVLEACQEMLKTDAVSALVNGGHQIIANIKLAEMCGPAKDILATGNATEAAKYVAEYDYGRAESESRNRDAEAQERHYERATHYNVSEETLNSRDSHKPHQRERSKRSNSRAKKTSFEANISDYIDKYQWAQDALKTYDAEHGTKLAQALKEASKSRSPLSTESQAAIYSVVAKAWVEQCPDTVKHFVRDAEIDFSAIKTNDDMKVLERRLLLAYSKIFDPAKIQAHQMFTDRISDFLKWHAGDAQEPDHFKGYPGTWEKFRKILEELQPGLRGTNSRTPEPPPIITRG